VTLTIPSLKPSFFAPDFWVEVLDVIEVAAVRNVTGDFVAVVGVKVVNVGAERLVAEVNWHCCEILIKIFA
jgi:hypothetical protein